MQIFSLLVPFCASVAAAVTYPELSDELYVHLQKDGKDANSIVARVQLRWDSLEYVAALALFDACNKVE